MEALERKKKLVQKNLPVEEKGNAPHGLMGGYRKKLGKDHSHRGK